MTDRWFTEEQVQKVARDLRENDRTMAEAMDMDVLFVSWEGLSPDKQQFWLERATKELLSIHPLDITRPIRLRDGMPVYDIKLSEDGLRVLARVIAWGQCGTQASWGRDGRSGEEDHPTDLVYA